ncbi:maleylpyruvate isomerase family mycothiol-dependent enzyme [Tsukamurella sp. 8F]|uniref:maleylpyruvate isomerase family mycothiol-dependent enzyme n=1 Tax=unclassified Tsukamurella TaxID=2633480 RepID=UPI0023B8899F|nr:MULTISPECIES: maleylpyruvate isomerase family mycothiol-dependent enzyme [unclassified Tsukamurella]MDF0529245.1 maleylpyruvate isomerase family mycothiol-dependent enzyme [Tsukamurella sp. 8J]MDF0585430.1 maleylpyruvate isomerase family mycothiol-dependent enzyme [Tsukamurella sp. 8F]
MGFRDLPRADQLSLVRCGTSYFARRLGETSDAELDERSALPGWGRRHLVAHVGYNALALARLMDWASTGTPTPMYESVDQRAREIDEGATLSAGALRNLFDHAVARLDEKWRRASDSAWQAEVRTAQGRTVPASETIWLRCREVWIHSVDLAGFGRFGDFPEVVLASLIDDVATAWRIRGEGAGLVFRPDGYEPIAIDDGPGAVPAQTVARRPVEIEGPLASVCRWATGRGAVGLRAPQAPPDPPRWL